MFLAADLDHIIINGVIQKTKRYRNNEISNKAATNTQYTTEFVWPGSAPGSAKDSHVEEDTDRTDKVCEETEPSATIGIFFINPKIQKNYDAFYQYLEDFDSQSGTRLDFYLPGFCRQGGDNWSDEDLYQKVYKQPWGQTPLRKC